MRYLSRVNGISQPSAKLDRLSDALNIILEGSDMGDDVLADAIAFDRTGCQIRWQQSQAQRARAAMWYDYQRHSHLPRLFCSLSLSSDCVLWYPERIPRRLHRSLGAL